MTPPYFYRVTFPRFYSVIGVLTTLITHSSSTTVSSAHLCMCRPTTGREAKISTTIPFPLRDLDIAPYVAGYTPSMGTSKYDLFAVVVHAGGMERGHYTAYARRMAPLGAGGEHSPTGGWHYFDDSTVVPVTESDVSSTRVASLAYLLFYSKQPTGGAVSGTTAGQAAPQ